MLLKGALDGMFEILRNGRARFRPQLSDRLHDGPSPATAKVRLQDAYQVHHVTRFFSQPVCGNQRFGTLKLFAFTGLNRAHESRALPGSFTFRGSLPLNPVETSVLSSLQDILVAFRESAFFSAVPKGGISRLPGRLRSESATRSVLNR